MIKEIKRPQRKEVSEKITDEDMIYFSLGIDTREFVLPSQRGDYHTDFRAVQLVENVRRGKRMKKMDFSGVNLKGADISEGHFEDCNFKGAVFYKTDASSCDFTGCCLDEAYIQDSDFDGSDFTHATFKRVFSKNNNWERAFLDEEASRYLTVLEKIIRLIEQGKIDIHTLSKSDLLHLDIRRLDFSKIDLEDLDLSMFALDGINLCGTYIDPKQLMSLEGWNSYCLDLRKTKEMTRARLCRRIMTEQEENLRQYAQRQQKVDKTIHTKKLKRPSVKQEGTADNRAWGLEKVRPEFLKEEQLRAQEEKKRLLEEQNQTKEFMSSRQSEHEKLPLSDERLSVDKTGQNNPKSMSDAINHSNDKMLKQSTETMIKTVVPDTFVVEKNDLKVVEQELNKRNNNDNQFVEIKYENNDSFVYKNIRQDPVKIVSHEDRHDDLNIPVPQPKKQSEEIVLSNEATVQPIISTTPYPYFLEKSEPIEEMPRKAETDDDETVHDVLSSGFSYEEMTQVLRTQGPLKVTSKLPKGRKARTKMKG